METPRASIRINQTGYSAGLPVHAVVTAGGPLCLEDGDGRVLRTLTPEPPPVDPASGDRAALVNLGQLAPGEYTLRCAGESRRLTVSARPWRAVTDALIKGLYYQRCGCALKEAHAGAYRHPACHTAPAVDWLDRAASRRVIGGWHDAGDYGKYVGPGAVTVAHLLYAWKLFPEGCGDALNIPETGSGIPDILSEALWELRWMLQMQRDDGAFHHKLTKARFAPFIMPQDDLETEYLMPVSHCATAAAAACLALASRVYQPCDPAFAAEALAAARCGWGWLQAHPDFEPFRNPEGVRTGWYGEQTDLDDRFWAACELYAATREPAFRAEAERLYARGQHLTSFGWADVGGLGALCCLFDLGEEAGSVLYTQLREDFLRQSGHALALSRASGYGTALPADGYVWGSILPILSGAMAMILHHRLTGRREMLEAALLQWHYALGLNALDLCFVTGFGQRSVQHPHHRPSGADGVEAPVPGLISGGPNQRFPYPTTRERLAPDTPPAKCFLDETPSADTNEIAIYWNSPAIFVGACFNSIPE